jgi:CheY-like chemotaxis protein
MKDKGGTLTLSLDDARLPEDLLAQDPGLSTGLYQKFSVRDTGMGIAAHILSRIFDPFFTTKDKGEGTGMGLAVVHGIVRSHKGAISVMSKPGEGSLFDLYFPVVTVVEEPKILQDKKIPTGTERILLVDDETALVKMGKKILEELGYEVIGFTSSYDALAAFKKNSDSYDLLITDLTMPVMTGKQLAEEVTRIRPGCPIILATGFGGNISEAEGKEIGIQAIVMKPFLKNSFANTVRKVLDEGKIDKKG